MDTKKFIKLLEDLKLLFAEKTENPEPEDPEFNEYPSRWADIPTRYKEDFKSWTVEYKQQNWDDNWKRAWEIYQREYIVFILDQKIGELK